MLTKGWSLMGLELLFVFLVGVLVGAAIPVGTYLLYRDTTK
jgi:hypothetical protein